MTKPTNAQHGFSLIELLVAIGILGIILTAVFSLVDSSNSVSRLVTSQTAMQSELRNAAAIIGDSVQRSSYIFPPQGSSVSTTSTPVTVDWSSFNLGAGNKQTGPHESTIFEVTASPSAARPPFLAMIVAPREPTAPCKESDSSTNPFQNGQGCYSFVAYYPVIRPKVTQGSVGNSSTSNALLAPNLAESTRWVIMEANVTLYNPIGGVRWDRVGCQFRNATNLCSTLDVPNPDPSPTNQVTAAALPALTCTNQCDNNTGNAHPQITDVNTFATRMRAIGTWMSTNPSRIRTDILVENIDEKGVSSIYGFDIRMPAETRDARGVTQVRMRLRGKANTGGTERTFTSDGNNSPIEYFFSPRNIAPFMVNTTTN
jgi:prepilin-type N-terminal cleavage/methylation domain-containing protein